MAALRTALASVRLRLQVWVRVPGRARVRVRVRVRVRARIHHRVGRRAQGCPSPVKTWPARRCMRLQQRTAMRGERSVSGGRGMWDREGSERKLRHLVAT